MRKQSGAALFVAMIILPVLVVLGLMLLGGSFLDLKMTDARASLDGSNITLNAASVDLLSAGSATPFASAANGTVLSSDSFEDVVSVVDSVSAELDCRRDYNPNGNGKCLYLDVKLSHSFGRKKSNGKKWGTNRMGLGVEQPLLAN